MENGGTVNWVGLGWIKDCIMDVESHKTHEMLE